MMIFKVSTYCTKAVGEGIRGEIAWHQMRYYLLLLVHVDFCVDTDLHEVIGITDRHPTLLEVKQELVEHGEAAILHVAYILHNFFISNLFAVLCMQFVEKMLTLWLQLCYYTALFTPAYPTTAYDGQRLNAERELKTHSLNAERANRDLRRLLILKS